MKAGTPAFTVNQVPEAMQVIMDRALEVGVSYITTTLFEADIANEVININ